MRRFPWIRMRKKTDPELQRHRTAQTAVDDGASEVDDAADDLARVKGFLAAVDHAASGEIDDAVATAVFGAIEATGTRRRIAVVGCLVTGFGVAGINHPVTAGRSRAISSAGVRTSVVVRRPVVTLFSAIDDAVATTAFAASATSIDDAVCWPRPSVLTPNGRTSSNGSRSRPWSRSWRRRCRC